MVWKAVGAVDVVDELLSEDCSIVSCAGWDEVCELGEAADDYEDGGVRWVLGGRGAT